MYENKKFVIKNTFKDMDSGDTDIILLIIDTSFNIRKEYEIKRVTKSFLEEYPEKALNYYIKDGYIWGNITRLGAVPNKVISSVEKIIKPLDHITIWDFLYEHFASLKIYDKKSNIIDELYRSKISKCYNKILYNDRVLFKLSHNEVELEEGFRLISSVDHFKRDEVVIVDGKKYYFCDKGLKSVMYNEFQFSSMENRAINRNYLNKLNQIKYIIHLLDKRVDDNLKRHGKDVDFKYLNNVVKMTIIDKINFLFNGASEEEIINQALKYEDLYVKKSIEYLSYLFHTKGGSINGQDC